MLPGSIPTLEDMVTQAYSLAVNLLAPTTYLQSQGITDALV
jgi:hypothetical protein